MYASKTRPRAFYDVLVIMVWAPFFDKTNLLQSRIYLQQLHFWARKALYEQEKDYSIVLHSI